MFTVGHLTFLVGLVKRSLCIVAFSNIFSFLSCILHHNLSLLLSFVKASQNLSNSDSIILYQYL